MNLPRLLPIPKLGGFLPALVPVFAGLSALGALTGGVAGVVQTINKANPAKAKLDELKRHNKTIKEIAIGKGLYLKPYRRGYGLLIINKSKKSK